MIRRFLMTQLAPLPLWILPLLVLLVALIAAIVPLGSIDIPSPQQRGL